MRKPLLLSLCAVGGAALGLGTKLRRRRATPGDVAMRRFTTWFVAPVWIAAGALDYWWHRRTRIETTAGLKESLMHSLMMMEAGPAVLAGIFLEVNAGVLVLMLVLSAMHEATAIWDVTSTAPQRLISPAEQHTHTFLEMIPFCVSAAAICTHWEQFQALVGSGPEKARFEIRPQHPSVPLSHVVALFAGMGLFGGLPHAEELWRCFRAQKKGLLGLDTPECARELFG